MTTGNATKLIKIARNRAIRTMGDGVIVLDPQDRVADINPAAERILDIVASQVQSKPAQEILMLYPAILAVLREREAQQCEVTLDNGGQPRIYDVRVAPLRRRESGPVMGHTIVWHDVTTLRHREEELRRAWKSAENASHAKSEFLSNMSHDLRTPLNAVIGYGEMLLEDARDGELRPHEADLEKIVGAGHHLLEFLDDILDMAKIEAGKMTRTAETFSVSDLITEVTTSLEGVRELYGNQLVLNVSEPMPELYQDRSKVHQILYQLLHNALKFTDQGTVTIAVSKETDGRDGISIAVSDTGPGIPLDRMPSIFEPYKDAKVLQSARSGAGLGLSVSHRLAQILEGDLQVESMVGKGSTFTVTFPTRVEESVLSAPEVSATPAALDLSGAPLLLVVDDDPVIHDLIQRFAQDIDGIEIVHAYDGLEGLKLARALQPRLITLDVMMPGRDGWATLAALKADPSVGAIPVYMMTSLDDRQIGFSLGAEDFLVKPITRSGVDRILNRFFHDTALQKGAL